MRKNKGASQRKIFGVFDLGRIPLLDGATGEPVAVQAPEPTTLDGFIRRDERREQSRLAAEQKVKDDAARVEYDRSVAAFYSQPVADIVGHLGMRDEFSGMQVVATDPQAGENFLVALTASGVTLTPDARTRLAAYCETQNTHSHGQFGITVGNLNAAFSRLKSLGVFADGELSEPTPAQTVETANAPNVGELFAKSNDDRNADRDLRGFIAGLVDAEFQSIARQWAYSVKTEFGHDITRFEIEQAWRFIRDHNLNPLRADSWNSARVALVHQCVLHQSLLTCAEVLADQLRTGSITAREYHHRCNVLERQGVLNRPRNYATATN